MLQQFFKWLATEGEIVGSSMATMRPPHVPETPPPVLREAELRKLLDACAETDFEGRRDNSMLRPFHDPVGVEAAVGPERVRVVDAVTPGRGQRR